MFQNNMSTNFTIAVGKSKVDKHWKNVNMSFNQFCNRIKNPIRTEETVAEYLSMPKDKRAEVKDVGGYIGGKLKIDNSARVKNNIAYRSLLTIDLDEVNSTLYHIICNTRLPFMNVIHSTHSHTPENPRLRIIAPFSREVDEEEYSLIVKYEVELLNLCVFDETSAEINQLMFWPSCPTDGEYFYKETLDMNAINVDHVLDFMRNEYPKISQPTTKEESPQEENIIAEQPLPKKGIIGAFCRAYTIKEAIDTFLPHIYIKTEDPTRYRYKTSSSDAGLCIVDGDYAFGHHASDPATKKKKLNAFDLVCLHKYNDSAKNMIDDVKDDPKVKIQLIQDRYKNIKVKIENWDWAKELEFDKKGNLLDKSNNVLLILLNDPRFNGFATNRLSNDIEVNGNLPWAEYRPKNAISWRDEDTVELKGILDNEFPELKDRNINIGFIQAAERRSFNPVKTYLDNLPEWDEVPRLNKLLVTTMKADDTPYVWAATRKTLVAAIARIYEPGIKFDSLLVLDGPQGIGKSTLFKQLAGNRYYSDSLTLTDMLDKTAAEKLQGNWIVEVAELSGMKKADIEKVKSFFSSTNDQYRPPYGTKVVHHERQCIIVATVNGDMGYLRDVTGNRRFWPIKLRQTERGMKWSLDKYTIDQIWAEAKVYYHNHEQLHLEDEYLDEAEKAQMEALDVDDNLGLIDTYVNTLLPEEWNNMSIIERYQYLNGDKTMVYKYGPGTQQRDIVCNLEIWCECFGKAKGTMPNSESRKITSSLLRLGWVKSPNNHDTFNIYGKQRAFLRRGWEQT